MVNWGKRGVPKDVDMLNNFRVVYTVSESVEGFVYMVDVVDVAAGA